MKVSELLELRRKQWKELERLCDMIKDKGRTHVTSQMMSRFATLYRAACADLALADEYRLPQNTVNYLHQLVGRAHNQLYRSRRFDFDSWRKIMLEDVPQRIFNDRCVQAAFILFWGAFLLSAALAASETMWPEYATKVLSEAQIETLEENFSEPLGNRPGSVNASMAGFLHLSQHWHRPKVLCQWVARYSWTRNYFVQCCFFGSGFWIHGASGCCSKRCFL